MLLANVSLCNAQSQVPGGSPDDINFDDENYYEIYEQFNEQLESNPDLFSESDLKKWARFNYYWHPRLQCEDDEQAGRFLSLINTMSEYMTSYVCEGENEGPSWEQLGPFSHSSNHMGRVDGVFVMPENHDEILVGTPSSGLWRTTNGTDEGEQIWDCVSDELGIPGVGVIRFERDPFDPDHFLAVTGLAAGQSSGYGPGPLESNDGGETWHVMESFYYENGELNDEAYSRIQKIKFSPTQQGVLYAITQKEAYSSVDNGENWSMYAFDPNEELNFHQNSTDLVVAPDGNSVYCVISAGYDQYGKILKSTNGGLNWSDITDLLFENFDVGITHFPLDTEFSNGLTEWLAISNFNGLEDWQIWNIGDDNGIKALIQDEPEISFVASDSETRWNTGDYELSVRAVIPPQSRLVFSLKRFSWSEDIEIFENTGTDPLELDVSILLEEDELNDFYPESLIDEIYHRVKLSCEPINGNMDNSEVWIGNYSFKKFEPAFKIKSGLMDVTEQSIYFYGSIEGGVIDYRAVLKSEDNGQSWFQNGPSQFPAWHMKVSSVDESIKYFGYVYFEKSIENQIDILGSIDLHVDIRGIQILEGTQGGVEDVVIVGTDGGIDRSDNGGNNWTSLNGTNLAITQFYELGIHDGIRNMALGGAQDGNNYKWSNEEWTSFDAADVHAIEVIDENRYIRYNNGSIQVRSLSDDSPINSSSGLFHLPMCLSVNQKAESAYAGILGGLLKIEYNNNYFESNIIEGHIESNQRVQQICVNENDPQVILCSLNGPNYPTHSDGTPVEEYPIKQFLRSTDGGETWQELTWAWEDPLNPNPEEVNVLIETTHWRVIGAIESDPDNPNRAWIGFRGMQSNFDNGAIDRVLYTENALDDPEDIVWTDISTGLPPLSINDLVYQHGTGDLLYAATDVGVFYFDGEEGDNGEWKCFNEDLPVCVVTSLKIHNCEQKLYASTYGRGAWRADLLRKGTQTLTEDLTIDVGETRMFKTNVELEPGVTLTVNGELLMPDDATIRVNPNAKVIINGGRIDNACDGMWRGIEVLGNPNQPQHDIYQGKVVMSNGGTIENATLGVSLGITNQNGTPDLSTTGGFITCATGAKFINCKRAVLAYDYQGTFSNRTKFHNTTFEINDELLNETAPFSQIRLRGVNGVLFQNCTFINNRTDEFPILDAGSGIIAANSGFEVKSCQFDNLSLGIGVKSFGFDDIKISENTFTGNLGGVSLRYSGLAEIVENTFVVSDPSDLNWLNDYVTSEPFGLYIGGSTGYEVEENLFYSSNIHKNVGLAVRNSGNHFNQIGFNNEFHTIEVGALVMGDNRYDPAEGATQATGLIFRCNDLGVQVSPGEYLDLKYSIALTNEGEVSMHQGVITAEVPGAGNRFYPVCPPATTDREFYVDDSSPELSYVNYIPFAQSETRPDCNTGLPYIGVMTSEIFFNKDVHCPSDLSSGGVIGDFRDRYYQNKATYETLLEVYKDTVNGGDTQFLLDLIDDEFVSSFELRNELLLASPRVTDRVLIASIQRDPTMNPWHVAQVLLANSPLPRNVLTALYRSDFDVYYKELVEDGQNGGISNTLIMESELSYYDALKETARMDFVRQAFRQDSTLALNDSIIHYLSEDADDEQLKTLMAYHLKRGQYQQAEALLAQAPNMRWTNDYVDVISVVVDALQDTSSSDAVIAANETTLLAVANENSPEAYLAQSVLEIYGLAEYDEVIVMPGVKPRSMQAHEDDQIKKRKALASVHPNPTKDMAYLNWRLPEGMPPQEVSMTVYSVHGQQLLTEFLNAEVGIREINTANWSPGLYLFQLRHDERLIESIRFEVIR